MNAAEVGDLLARMALVDNRKPPEDDEAKAAMIMTWVELIGDLNYADAVQAVRDHYRESREWLMPSDIRQRVKAIREERIKHSVIAAPAPELANDPAAYRDELMESLHVAGDGHAELLVADGPKMIGPPPGERTGGPPVSLRGAIRQLRRDLGDAREQRGIESPEAIAARQVAEQRAAEAARSKTEEAS
jgi:hypothetical protein